MCQTESENFNSKLEHTFIVSCLFCLEAYEGRTEGVTLVIGITSLFMASPGIKLLLVLRAAVMKEQLSW